MDTQVKQEGGPNSTSGTGGKLACVVPVLADKLHRDWLIGNPDFLECPLLEVYFGEPATL